MINMLKVPNGWINDPTGMVRFKDRYHLYFQHLPGKREWGFGIGWAHATSRDLKDWRIFKKRAVAPSKWYDKDGCFSGSVIVQDDTIFLAYTGVILKDEGTFSEYQCMATSKDGYRFTKFQEPIISTPPITNTQGWRDPYLFKHNKTYYMLIGSAWDNKGHILLYKGDKQLPCQWTYQGILHSIDNEVCECPFIIKLKNNVWMLGVSCEHKQPIYWLGTFNGSSFKSLTKKPKEIKMKGYDVYAPTVSVIDNIPYMWMWVKGTDTLLGPINLSYDEISNDLLMSN
jgi:beta-fructofuranosidase